MAIFFDLGIPYLERDDLPAPDKKARWETRVRSAARAMELGYAGVAYDRPLRGVAAEPDRCRAPHLRLAPLLERAPALASSAALHRARLGAPPDAPFRQYTRVTVVLDGRVAAAALGHRNPVLRSYDIVAARPINQEAFNEACTSADIDLIAIDFSQKLPFRLKLSVVEAAVKRGVYFEITYSYLIADVHVRRQMLSDARILVDRTRGKNLIITSAALTANELRGPYDVANLSAFLLGLSMERAKAATSRNCRSLIASALRKKHFHKESIRIERILPDDKFDPKKAWFGDWNNWDPISSVEGDLLLTEKLSAANEPKNSIAIDFMSIADETPLKGGIFHVGHYLLSQGSKATVSPFAKKIEASDVTNEVLSATADEITEQDRLSEVSGRLVMKVTHSDAQMSACKCNLASPLDVATLSANAKEIGQTVVQNENPRCFNGNGMVSDVQDENPRCFNGNDIVYDEASFHLEKLEDRIVAAKCMVPQDTSLMHSPLPEDMQISEVFMEDHKSPDEPDANSGAIETSKLVTEFLDCVPSFSSDQTSLVHAETSCTPMENDILKEQISAGVEHCEEKNEVSCPHGINLQKDFIEQSNELGQSAIPLIYQIHSENTNTHSKTNEQEQGQSALIENDAQLKDTFVEIKKQKQIRDVGTDGARFYKLKTGKRRCEEGSYPAYPLPIKRLLKPMFFKKKSWRLRRPRKHK